MCVFHFLSENLVCADNVRLQHLMKIVLHSSQYITASTLFCLNSYLSLIILQHSFLVYSLSLSLSIYIYIYISLILIVFVMGGRWPYSCCYCGVLSPGLVQYCSQPSCVIAVKLFSQKNKKLDEPDMLDTAGEVGTSSWGMYSCGPLYMDEQRQDIQFEPSYSSSVSIRDVALRICRKKWTIGRCGERRSGISVLIA